MLMRGRADDGASVYSFLQPAEESREAERVAHHARQRPLVEIDQAAVARGRRCKRSIASWNVMTGRIYAG